MSIILVLFAILGILFGGWLIAGVVGSRHPAERLGVGILVGSTLTTYFMFLLFDYLHIHFTVVNIFLAIAIQLVIGIFLSQALHLSIKKDLLYLREWLLRGWQFRSTLRIDFAFVCLLTLIVGYTFIQNLYWPVFDWDALALYDFRAMVISRTGDMLDGIRRGYFLHYPPYTSLLHSINYILGDHHPKVWYSLLFLAMLLIFYSLLRRDTSRKVALLGTCFLAIVPVLFDHAQMAYTNLPHAIFVGLGYLFFMIWWRSGRRADLLIGSFLVAFSLWIRDTEPFWIPAVMLIVAGTVRHRKDWVWVALSLFMILFVKVPWLRYEFFYDKVIPEAPTTVVWKVMMHVSLHDAMVHVVHVLVFLKMAVWTLFERFSIALVIAFVYAFSRRDVDRIMEFGLLAFFVAYIMFGTFLFSFEYPGWDKIPDSATRMSMFLLLICVYLIMRSELWLQFQRSYLSKKVLPTQLPKRKRLKRRV